MTLSDQSNSKPRACVEGLYQFWLTPPHSHHLLLPFRPGLQRPGLQPFYGNPEEAVVITSNGGIDKNGQRPTSKELAHAVTSCSAFVILLSMPRDSGA